MPDPGLETKLSAKTPDCRTAPGFAGVVVVLGENVALYANDALLAEAGDMDARQARAIVVAMAVVMVMRVVMVVVVVVMMAMIMIMVVVIVRVIMVMMIVIVIVSLVMRMIMRMIMAVLWLSFDAGCSAAADRAH